MQGELSRCRELGSGRPGVAGVGCSFRRLFHVAVGKTRKARQRAPLQSTLVPRHRVLAKPIRKKVLEGARTGDNLRRQQEAGGGGDGRNSRPQGDYFVAGEADEAQEKRRRDIVDSCGYLVAKYSRAVWCRAYYCEAGNRWEIFPPQGGNHEVVPKSDVVWNCKVRQHPDLFRKVGSSCGLGPTARRGGPLAHSPFPPATTSYVLMSKTSSQLMNFNVGEPLAGRRRHEPRQRSQ